MPYSTNSDILDSVRKVLPNEAQTIWRKAFNNAFDGDEAKAFAVAWAAVKNAGYKRGKEGIWELKKMDLLKVDTDKRLVFGWFNICTINDKLVKDFQGEEIPTSVLEEGSYNFVLNYRMAGEEHMRKGIGRLVECVMFTKEKCEAMVKSLKAQGIEASIDLKCEGMWGGFYIDDDEIWEQIKKGNYPAFSIGGKKVVDNEQT